MDTQSSTMPIQEKKRGKFIGKLYFVVFILLVGTGVYFYFWYTSTSKLRVEALQVTAQAQSYQTLHDEILKESNRCKDFIVQKEGDFGGFEYCKKFIQWSDTLPLSK